MPLVLVSGAAGFIGARVCQELVRQGYQVLGVDNLNSAYDVRLKNWRLQHLLKLDGFQFEKLDITDFAGLTALAEKSSAINAVINLAARAGVRASVENPWEFLSTNTVGALNLMELAVRYQIPKLVLASTSSIYGENAPYPTPEDADSSHPLQPYAASKKGAESMAHAYHFLHGLDVTVFRYFTVYGPAGRPDMVMFRFCQWIAEGRPVHLNGDGTQTRGFTYVDDIARGTVAGLKPLGYEIINLGGHETISLNEMTAKMEQLLGRKAEIVHHPPQKADMLANLANVDKARQILNWHPEVGLDQGMRALVQWYLDHREWASQIETS